MRSVGISDIQPFLPHRHYQLSQWLNSRPLEARAALSRAVRATGQVQMRLPYANEDTVTMASTAIWHMLRKQSNAPYIPRLHYLAAGTETGVDNAKPISAYMLEALADTELDLPQQLSTFQVQHACAGGTIALFSLCALLQVSNDEHESALMVCSDIAHYRQNAAAEITQGAGAVALLVSAAPRLIALDVSKMGHASRGVDDFFRPLGSLGATVQGNYSIQCYQNALKIAMHDFAWRCDKSIARILDETDYVVMHSPFKSMASRALRSLLITHTDYGPSQIKEYTKQRGLTDAVEPIGIVGNIYSGSVYFMLYCLLAQQYRSIGDGIVGKRLLICSYGSGCTMTVMSGVVAEGAPRVIANWNMEEILAQSTPISDNEYQQWTRTPYALKAKDLQEPAGQQEDKLPGAYLHAIREDGYREYRFRR